MFILEQRQNGRSALPQQPALALSAKPRPSFGLQRGDLNVCAQLRLYKVPGSRDKGVGCSAVFPSAGQVIKLRWWEGVTPT